MGGRRQQRGPARQPAPTRSSTTKIPAILASTTDRRGPSLAELAERTGATPGEVLAVLWDLREASRERRP
jgi:hypothetical protein